MKDLRRNMSKRSVVRRKPLMTDGLPILVAIVGGSGAGKTWLAEQLEARLGGNIARFCADDFYRDQSHLPPARRARINYDHPRAIDWERLEGVLKDCREEKETRIPQYDFATHTRRKNEKRLKPGPLIIVDGLWLLRRRAVRRHFHLTIFIKCPTKLRLQRRLARDLLSRGRDSASVIRQFRETVEPMNARHVSPQVRWADIRLKTPILAATVSLIADELAARLNAGND